MRKNCLIYSGDNMPFALVTIGLLLVITGFQNTYSQLGSQIAKDFTGPANFTYWIIALGVVGALGYNDSLKPFSRAFMALIVVVIFLSNKGFFAALNQAIQAGTSTSPLHAGGNNVVASATGAASSGGIGLGDIASIAEIGASFL